MATYATKKFLDADGLTYFASLLNNYPDNEVLGVVINAIQDALDQKVDTKDVVVFKVNNLYVNTQTNTMTVQLDYNALKQSFVGLDTPIIILEEINNEDLWSIERCYLTRTSREASFGSIYLTGIHLSNNIAYAIYGAMEQNQTSITFTCTPLNPPQPETMSNVKTMLAKYGLDTTTVYTENTAGTATAGGSVLTQ